MERSVTVTLPYPPSANRYKAYRIVNPNSKNRFVSWYLTKEAEEYKTVVAAAILGAGLTEPYEGRIRVDYTIYPQRPQDWQKRQRQQGDAWSDSVRCLDLDNCQKVMLDAMNGVAFLDDSWIREIHAQRAEPDGEARCVVTITAMEAPKKTQTTLLF